MNRDERIRRFGIECLGPDPAHDGIFFKAGTWRPGGEYIQKLIIRNVSTSVKKLKYKLPSTRYFSMAYPEPITLSPGIFHEVDVVFRPVEYEPYDDNMYIKLLDGIDGNGFHIPVRATIDNLALRAPEGLDLGFCATHQITQLTFYLENIGEIDAPYAWDVPAPFSLSPASGVVPTGSSHEITLSIRPVDASVFVSQAVCHVGHGVHAIIPQPLLVTKLSAIAKFAHLSVSDELLSFDECVSGVAPPPREIVLYNHSVVPAEFTLSRLDNDRDAVFDVLPSRGVLPPRSELCVTIKYRALAMGVSTLDRYAFRTPGGSNAVFALRGTAMPPRVSLFKDVAPRAERETESERDTQSGHNPNNTQGKSANAVSANTSSSLLLTGTLKGDVEGAPLFSLNFRDIELGRVETRLLYLANDSSREVAFAVIGDPAGIFRMSPRQGVIPPFVRNYPVKVAFVPLQPINYYRRFFVLIADALPLFYDCLGTGFVRAKGEVKEQRPAPLRHAHVQAYRNRLIAGQGALSPDELDASYAERESVLRGLDYFPEEDEEEGIEENLETAESRLRKREIESRLLPSEFFAHTGKAGTRALSVSALQRPVTRTGESVRPLVAPAHELFLSLCDGSAREIVLDRTHCDFGFTPFRSRSAAQRVTITNNTHAKVVVQWSVPAVHEDNGSEREAHTQREREGLNANGARSSKEKAIVTVDGEEREREELRAFSLSPLSAEIAPGQSHSFEVVFTPKQSNRNFFSQLEAFVFFKNQRTFRLVNDFSLTPPWCLTLSAMGHTFSSGQLLAKACFAGGAVARGKLVFPCAFVGEAIYQTIMIRNTSNLPSTFRLELGWKHKTAERALLSSTAKNGGNNNNSNNADNGHLGVFSVNPSVGEIAAESFALVCVRFSPTQQRKYSELLRLELNGDPDGGGKLLLEGEGGRPFLVVQDLLQSGGQSGQQTNAASAAAALSPQGPERLWGLPAAPWPRDYVPQGQLGVLFVKPTCVGLTSQRKVTLKNATRLPCKFRVQVTCQDGADSDALRVSPSHGVVRGNDCVSLLLVFTPHSVKTYNFALSVSVYPIGGKSRRILDANQPGPVAAPELLQSFSLSVRGEGEIGALSFSPAESAFAVRLVHTSEESALWLENTSSAELQYALYYREDFEPDAVDREREKERSPVMAMLPIERERENESETQRESEKTSLSHKNKTATTISFEKYDKTSPNTQNNQNLVLISNPSTAAEDPLTATAAAAQFEHSLFCGAPRGAIAARSRLRVRVLYRPAKSGFFRFSIFAQIRAVDPITREGVEMSNDEAALRRVLAGKERETEIESEIERQREIERELLSLPLSASITARAAFPRLLFEDIRTDDCALQISHIESLWARFSLSRLNHDLSVPLTQREISHNHASHPLTMRDLPVYPMEFSPAVLHTAPQGVTILLRNHGYLETRFSVHLPNEKTLSLESWCDEDEPSEELNRLIAIIEELKLFTIEPRNGRLLPGETCLLRVSYQHNSLKYNGIHNLPVRVSLSQGKQFFLDLRGRTLAPLSLSLTTNTNTAANAIAANTSMASRRSSTRGERERDREQSGENSSVSSPVFPDILLVLGARKHDNSLCLAPVPIGLSPVATGGYAVHENGTVLDSAPLQLTELHNVSACGVRYEVFVLPPLSPSPSLSVNSERETETVFETLSPRELSLLDSAVDSGGEAVKRENFQCEVLRCANREGEIRDGLSLSLQWYFYPLQAKEYFFPIVIRYCVSPVSDVNGNNGSYGVAFADSLMSGKSSTSQRRTSSQQRNNAGLNGTISRNENAFGSQQSLLSAVQHSVQQQPVQYKYLQAVLRVRGYDPRVARPAPFEAHFAGGVAPSRPALRLSDKPVQLFEDLCDFHLVPMRSRVKRILTLVNDSASQSFEFSVDESSCELCKDGLLCIEPTFGRIEPQGRAVVELTLQAMSQCAVLSDSVRIMVREVLRGVNKSRGGTRQQIIDKLKARKVQESEHESVVGRATFTRSVQVLLSEHGEARRAPADPLLAPPLDTAEQERKRKTAKLPSTVARSGAVVAPSLAGTLRALRPELGENEEDWENVQAHDKGESMLINNNKSNASLLPLPAAPERERQRDAAQSKSVAFHDNALSLSASPSVSPSRGKLLSSHTDLAGSRGGTTRERESVTGGATRRTGASQSGAYTMIGATYFVIARVKGEIFSEQTLRCILQREGDKNKNKSDREGEEDDEERDRESEKETEREREEEQDVMLQYLVPRGAAPFIPPVNGGKKFFDAAFVAEQERARNKSRVNIALVKDRDDELRDVAECVFDALLKNTLSLPAMAQTLHEALQTEEEREKAILPLNAQTPISAPLTPYVKHVKSEFGVYFREVEPSLDLHELVILELKHLLKDDECDVAALESVSCATAQWTKNEEKLLLLDETEYSLSPLALKHALEEWRLQELEMFKNVLNDLDALAQASMSSQRSLNQPKSILIKSWVYELSLAAQRALEERVVSARDLRNAAPSTKRAAQEKAERELREREKRSRSRSRTPSPQRPRSESNDACSTTSQTLASSMSLSPHSSSRSVTSLREREKERERDAARAALDPKVAFEQVAQNDEFAVIATETLNALFLGLMKDELFNSV